MKERQVLTAQTVQKKICMATCCTSFDRSEIRALHGSNMVLMVKLRWWSVIGKHTLH